MSPLRKGLRVARVPASPPAKRTSRRQSGAARGVSFAVVSSIAQELPGVEVGSSYGTPALKVRAKLVARLHDDGVTLVLRCTPTVRDHLLATAPSQFFLTDHYRPYPWVLVRLPVVGVADLRPLLEDAWRQVAGKRLAAALDARRAARP